jgi:hypothetical protein
MAGFTERDEDAVDVVGAHHRVDRVHACVRQGQDARRLEPGQDGLDGLERVVGRVHHEVLHAAAGDDRLDHGAHLGHDRRCFRRHVRASHEDGLGGEERADRAQAVHDQRGAAGDEIDDAVGQAHRGGDLDGAGDGHDLGFDATLAEGRLGRVRVARGQAQPGQVLQAASRRLVGHRRLQAAVAVAQLGQDLQLGASLDEQVGAGDAQVGDPVGHELDDVVGAHEEDVQREALDLGRQRARAVLEAQARVVEQLQGRRLHAALVGDGQSDPARLAAREGGHPALVGDHLGPSSVGRRSSASR